MLRPFQIACVLKGDVGLKLLKTQTNASFMKLAIPKIRRMLHDSVNVRQTSFQICKPRNTGPLALARYREQREKILS